MKTLLIIIMLLIPVQSFAFDEWSKTDIALEAVYTTLHVIDWGQTLNIADNPYRYYETNPILGKCPSRSDVNVYMASSLVLHTIVTAVLPKEYRPWFQAVTIGIEGAMLINNFNLGIKTAF